MAKKKAKRKAKPKKKVANKGPAAKAVPEHDVVEVPHEYADELEKLNKALLAYKDGANKEKVRQVEKKLQEALDEIRGMEKIHAPKEHGYEYKAVKVAPRVIKPYKRKPRPLTAYNVFIKNQIDAGATFSQAVKMWKAHKELEAEEKRGVVGKLFKKKKEKKEEKKEEKKDKKKEKKVKKKEKKKKKKSEAAIAAEKVREAIKKGTIDIAMVSDAIVKIMDSKKKAKVKDMSRWLGIKPSRIIEVVAVIDNREIIVKYPLVGGPKLFLKRKKKK